MQNRYKQAEVIPHSIRSRFTEITIRPPVDPQQLYQLNWHLCQAVVEPLGVQMPDSTIRTSLAVLSPRDQRKHLQAACESAAANGRNQLEHSDFAPGVLQLDHWQAVQQVTGRRTSRQSRSRSGTLGGTLH
jgi:AAA+ superfamily predicted ATPase